MTRPHAEVAERKIERLDVRATPKQKQRLVEAAALNQQSVTEYVLRHAVAAAERDLESHKVMRLSDEASQAFVNALLSLRTPNERLQQAAARHREAL